MSIKISNLTRQQCNELYAQVLKDNDYETMRELCKTDLYFLLSVACKRQDMNRDWVYERIREVEKSPDGHLDLWFRAGYKSSIITFGLTIQDILKNPEITIGLFSHTRPISKSFGAQVKREFETNDFLKKLFPDILYQDPHKESPKWSLDDGIIVKRKTNPKESTLETWGLVDGQPTSKHYQLMIFDDIVTKDSVSTPEMIAKTTEAFRLSFNLGAEVCRKRFIGTRYHSNDTYQTIIDSGTARPRIHSATKDGTMKGESVFLTQEDLDNKLRDMGSYVFSSQMLQNPLADKVMGFRSEWLEYYDVLRGSSKWNYYIVVDPASEKKKDSDFTVILVVGCAPDGNYYLVDGIRDRMNLTERCSALFKLHRLWKPLKVGYEKYGMQSDIEHIKYVQQQEGYRFFIVELKGSMPKNDRIRRLVPIFENHRMWFPRSLHFVGSDGKVVDLVSTVVRDEYMTFPVGKHDDFMDCLSRIMDEEMHVKFPTVKEDGVGLAVPVTDSQEVYDPLVIKKKGRHQMRPINRVPVTTWRELMTRI
jgi:predicted phage terminase large subunit-like protein